MINKLIFPLNIWLLLFCTAVCFSACTTSTETSPTVTRDTLFQLPPTPTTLPLATSAQTPTSTITNTATPLPILSMADADSLLQGPLIAYRVQNGYGYLLLLDLGTLAIREVRQEHLEIPFHLQWMDNGCYLYARGNLIDLQGNIVERTNDPDKGEAHFEVPLLSPDKQKGAREIFLGDHDEVELEYLRLEILDRLDPEFQIELAPNGGAYTFAWSPDGNWLAFSDFDDNFILQIYRATPDGEMVEQLTHHLEDPGVLHAITWSPDGQHIAYAAQALLSGQLEGWVGLISLPDSRTMAIKPDYFQYTRDLWWSEDSSRIAFVGESFSVAPDGLKGAQMHWADGNSGTILNSVYRSQTPNQSFDLVVPVGDIDTVFFASRDGYYLYDATENKYEKIFEYLPTDGLIRDFVPSPFDFPGEVACLNPEE